MKNSIAGFWRCPNCGHEFDNENQSHYRHAHSVDDHFRNKPPVLSIRWSHLLKAGRRRSRKRRREQGPPPGWSTRLPQRTAHCSWIWIFSLSSVEVYLLTYRLFGASPVRPLCASSSQDGAPTRCSFPLADRPQSQVWWNKLQPYWLDRVQWNESIVRWNQWPAHHRLLIPKSSAVFLQSPLRGY